jgi:hypothetical protein
MPAFEQNYVVRLPIFEFTRKFPLTDNEVRTKRMVRTSS